MLSDLINDRSRIMWIAIRTIVGRWRRGLRLDNDQYSSRRRWAHQVDRRRFDVQLLPFYRASSMGISVRLNRPGPTCRATRSNYIHQLGEGRRRRV